MNFYAFNIGDYAGATRHLSWDEDMAYRRMLDAYYSREAPLPLDRRSVYRLVGASEDRQRQAVDAVLLEFFVEEHDGWHNSRADEEVAKAVAKSNQSAKKKEGERERQSRHRNRRKELFAILRQKGIVPSFDTTTKEMEALAKGGVTVTRDTPNVTGDKMYACDRQNGVSAVPHEIQRDTADVTPNTGTVTPYVTRDKAPVTPDNTAINPNPNPNIKDEAAARARRREIFDETEAALRTIPELADHPIRTNTVIASIFGLVHDRGFDLHSQVIPSIRRQLVSAKAPIKSWGYFVAGILEDAATPTATAGGPTHAAARRKPTRDETFAAIERRIEQLREAES